MRSHDHPHFIQDYIGQFPSQSLKLCGLILPLKFKIDFVFLNNLGGKFHSNIKQNNDPFYIQHMALFEYHFCFTKMFSRGRYGIVQRCISKKTQEAVATKYLRLRTKRRVEIRREADLHQRLLHPHIITFFDAYEAGRNLIIVMEM